MGKPSAPPAPDYAAAAAAQGVANQKAGQQTAVLNNPNVISPYGNQTVTFNPSKTVDQAGYDRAMQNYQNQQGQTDEYGNSIGGSAPDISQYTTTGDMQPTVTQTLTPDAQAALTAQQGVQRRLADLGTQAVGTASNILGTPFNYNGPQIQTSLGQNMPVNYGPAMGQYGMAGSVPSGAYGQAGSVGAGQYGMAQGGVAGPNIQSSFGGYGDVQNAPAGGQYGQAGGVNADQYGNLRTGADMSGVARMPVNAGMTGQQAIMNRLQPQLAQQSAATAQQLANQGITPGSEAYNNAMREQQQGQNDLLSQAALQGIGLDMSANQQGYGQAMGQAGLYNQALGQGFGQAVTGQQLGNQAIGQNFGQGMQSNAAQNAAQAQRYGQASGNAGFNNAAQLSQFQSNLANQQAGNQAIAQNYGQGMSSQQLQNQAIGQNYGQAMSSQDQANAAMGQNYGQAGTSAGLYNQAAAQQFNQNLGAAQFGNTATQQAYQQQLAQYNQPLNQIAALMSGSQIQAPQFQQYSGGGQIGAAPVAQAATNQGNYNTAAYNAKMGALGSLYGGIGGIVGGAAGGPGGIMGMFTGGK